MEQLKHQCGVAMVRLRKPMRYYLEKYGTARYALNKLYLLMQKQYNRGQEGAGMICISLASEAGEEFLFRERKEGKSAMTDLFASVGKQIAAEKDSAVVPFMGECYMGHLRYSTTGRSGLTHIHPHLRRSNYRCKTLALCGNFNLTNVDEVFGHLKELGQHPRRMSDTTILLELFGHYLDKHGGKTANVLQDAVPLLDGGFVLCGTTGSGEMFAVRDPWGIRTAFCYADDEIVVVASERAAIQTVMNVPIDSIDEIEAGEVLLLSAQGEVLRQTVMKPYPKKACSFERVYFSRGNDQEIYKERKELGRAIVPQVLEAIDYDVENSVFSFIPNTAEIAFMGMVEGLNDYLNTQKSKMICGLNNLDAASVSKIIACQVRTEKVAVKDLKLRTFISDYGERNELANHVYDITYGSIRPDTDNLVVIDDSIVRGTTLRQSIITILSRLQPKKLIIVSSSPQIRYPDFYGIDMSNITDLIAFRAAIALVPKEILHRIYRKCIAQETKPKEQLVNYVQEIYHRFSDEEISAQIATLVTPPSIKHPVEIIFQKRESLSKICHQHNGDWYFTGNYPTAGGIKQLNDIFLKSLQLH